MPKCVVVSPTSLRKPLDIVPDDGRYAKAQQSLSEAHAAMVAARNHLPDVRRRMNAALDAVDALKTCLQARQARQMLRARRWMRPRPLCWIITAGLMRDENTKPCSCGTL